MIKNEEEKEEALESNECHNNNFSIGLLWKRGKRMGEGAAMSINPK